jgi:predicted nucleotidyltransferase component of viral defense system
MGGIDYKALYALQDEVLALVFRVENEFYLTGGTCLSRFYLEKRYSDDLDFFTNSSSRYSFAVKNIKNELIKYFDIKVEVDSKDFIRLRVNELLQLDFVNDISSRYKDVIVTKDNIIIDNINNILSNKITAVIGRDNPKDIFDIYLIAKNYDFLWKDILESAHEKAGFSDDELLVRLKSFPFSLMKNIKLIDSDFLENFEKEFPKIIDLIGNI